MIVLESEYAELRVLVQRVYLKMVVESGLTSEVLDVFLIVISSEHKVIRFVLFRFRASDSSLCAFYFL